MTTDMDIGVGTAGMGVGWPEEGRRGKTGTIVIEKTRIKKMNSLLGRLSFKIKGIGATVLFCLVYNTQIIAVVSHYVTQERECLSS